MSLVLYPVPSEDTAHNPLEYRSSAVYKYIIGFIVNLESGLVLWVLEPDMEANLRINIDTIVF